MKTLKPSRYQTGATLALLAAIICFTRAIAPGTTWWAPWLWSIGAGLSAYWAVRWTMVAAALLAVDALQTATEKESKR